MCRSAGTAGHRVRGWLHLPAGHDGPLPAIVQYIGYGGGRGLPHESVLWAAAGYAHLVMDTRGQGSTWSIGDTPDAEADGAPAHPGFMTRGILDPATYYYRRVFADAVRAVEAARSHPAVDPARVAVTGGSQGGGISIAVAGLVPDVAAVMTDVPFLADFRRAITITDEDPYTEIARYLKAHRDHTDRVLETLSYFDVAILGRRAKAPGALLGRVDGRDLPALDRLRRIQRVRRSQGDHRVPLQRPRGRRGVPRHRQDALDRRSVRRAAWTARLTGLRIALFITCYNDLLYPEVGQAIVRLLRRLGHEVEFPAEQTCCGQMHFNSGYQDACIPLVQRFVDAFAGYDAVVTPSGSCASMVRRYHPLVAGLAADGGVDAGLPERVATVSPTVYELSEFLVDVLGVTDVGARFPHTVAFHPTCHSTRLLGVGDRPTRLLAAVDGLTLVDLPRSEACCGFGGTFAVKNADTSVAMGLDKVDDVLGSGADVLTAGDTSCLMHIGGLLSRRGSPVRVMHLAEILASTGADA